MILIKSFQKSLDIKINTDFEKKRLKATIAELQNECEIKNQLINQQELDIIKLKNRVTQLEKKVKFVFKKWKKS